MVGVSASVNLPLHHKVQKFSSGTGSFGWSRKKGRKTVVVVATYLLTYLLGVDGRLMYWTDVNERSPKIEYSWMTGEERLTLVSERLLRPTGLAVDYYKNDRVFWCDSKLNVVESVNYDGSDRAVVARSGQSPRGF